MNIDLFLDSLIRNLLDVSSFMISTFQFELLFLDLTNKKKQQQDSSLIMLFLIKCGSFSIRPRMSKHTPFQLVFCSWVKFFGNIFVQTLRSEINTQSIYPSWTGDSNLMDSNSFHKESIKVWRDLSLSSRTWLSRKRFILGFTVNNLHHLQTWTQDMA